MKRKEERRDIVNQRPLTPIVTDRPGYDPQLNQIVENAYREGRHKGFLEGYKKGVTDEREQLRRVVKGKARCHDCAVAGMLEFPGVVEKG